FRYWTLNVSRSLFERERSGARRYYCCCSASRRRCGSSAPGRCSWGGEVLQQAGRGGVESRERNRVVREPSGVERIVNDVRDCREIAATFGRCRNGRHLA